MDLDFASCKQSGFSLIELMVVIAIVALLSAVAIPVYQTYLLRSRMYAVMKLVDDAKEQAVAHYARYGTFSNTPAIPALNYWNSGTQAYCDGNCPIADLVRIKIFDSGASAKTGGLAFTVSSNLATAAGGTVNQSSLWIVFKDVNGVINTYCGNATASNPGHTWTLTSPLIPANCTYDPLDPYF